MAVVGDFLVGKALELLYGGVQQLIADNLLFKSLSTDIRDKLDALRPMIQKMVQRQQLQDCPEDPVLRDLRVLMEEGAVVVRSCFSEIRIWNIYKKYKYTNKLRKLNESLEKQLVLLNVRVAVVTDENNGMLRKLVEKVDLNKSAQIEAWFALPELPALIVGLENPLEELKSKLFEDEVKMLVLTAPGGCGKTTLATKFCQDQQVKDLYRNGVFPVKWIQQIVEKEGDIPVLLVLDDVWAGSESLLEKFEFQMSNYKILVTSRSEFPRFGSPYPLQLLNDDNAMKLFHHTAFLGDRSSHIPIDLSKKVVKHCNGFPLAITVVGRSLCGQPIEIWRSRVSEWSKGTSILDCEMELFNCLQSSFDALDNETPMVKECLLDLGAFPEDAKIQVTALIDMWAELYDLDEEASCIAKLYELHNRNIALLQVPKGGRSLETIQEAIDYSGCVVRQHDLLRELAIYNSKRGSMDQRERLILEICGNNFPKWWREQKYPDMNARLVSISTDEELSVKLPSIELPEAEVLVLNFQSNTSHALPKFVERMNKLKMLLVINYSSRCTKLDNFQVLGSLSNLRSLRLDGIMFSCINECPVQLKNLHKLYLRAGSKYEKDPVNLSQVFPNLKELVFDGYLPEKLCVDGLIYLKTLKVTNQLWEVSELPKGIENLISLEVLWLETRTEHYDDPDVNLTKLKCLENGLTMSQNKFLMKLPEDMGKLMSLTQLIIQHFSFWKFMPESIGNLVNLQVLIVRGCTSLYELPESIINLQKLEILDIHYCYRMTELPEQIGKLKSLRKLCMSCCDTLDKLPQSVSDLEQLEEVICSEWAAEYLWTPLLLTLKNLSIVVSREEVIVEAVTETNCCIQ